MKVSVVIPFFNCKKYIIECLYSVKNQSFSDFEIVLVNDGSTDGTDAIVSEWMRINEGIRHILTNIIKGFLLHEMLD